MLNGDKGKLDVFLFRCLRLILKTQRQDHRKSEDMLEDARMEYTKREVWWRRVQDTGHILWKDPINDCMASITWAPGRKWVRAEGPRTQKKNCQRRSRPVDGVILDQVQTTTIDRTTSRECVEALCATLAWEKHEENKSSLDKLCKVWNYWNQSPLSPSSPCWLTSCFSLKSH